MASINSFIHSGYFYSTSSSAGRPSHCRSNLTNANTWWKEDYSTVCGWSMGIELWSYAQHTSVCYTILHNIIFDYTMLSTTLHPATAGFALWTACGLFHFRLSWTASQWDRMSWSVEWLQGTLIAMEPRPRVFTRRPLLVAYTESPGVCHFIAK